MNEENIHCVRKKKQSLFEWLLNLCGYKIWPKTHNDPRIKGPLPRVLTSEQVKEMEKLQRSVADDGTAPSEVEGSLARNKLNPQESR